MYVGASDGQTHHLHAVSSDVVQPAPLEVRPTCQARGGSRDYWESLQADASSTPNLAGSPGADGGRFKIGHIRDLSPDVPLVPLKGGSSYWDEYHGAAGKPLQSQPASAAAADLDTKDKMAVKRVNSAAYWDAEQWDPDRRVYVGAEAGMQNHMQAIDPSKEDSPTVWRVWAGGLSSENLGHDAGAAPLIDLQSCCDPKVRLEDLYEILDESVGSGSFGVVRRSRHRGSGKECVIKSVGKEAAGERYRALLVDRHLGERLLWMSKQAKHPNIATYFDILEGPQHFFIVMEELLGPELMEQVEEFFPVTEAYLQCIMKQIFQALSHLHETVGLVHRDVKLSNFRFRESANSQGLTLLDFGFAMSLSEPWDRAVCGTLMFMAPEVIGSKAEAPYLAAMDVWAAGVILYVLLTGDAPAEEAQVRLFGRGGPAADVALDRALAAHELNKASEESLKLLKNILVLDPSLRITAQDALQHEWFQLDAGRRVCVPLEKYRRTRSASMSSQVSTPKALPSRERTPKKMLDLPQPAFEPLERIVSEGVEEVKN